MAITADALRSGIGEMSAYSRISIRNDELGKASLRQRLACHFSRSEAKRVNQETIDALKAAVLNDPRYSGIQDKVDLVFGEMGSKYAIRAKHVKAAFASLDKCAFNTDAGKRSFLVQDVKLRLMANSLASPQGDADAISDNAWAFSFKDEWESCGHAGGMRPGLENWTPHVRSLEPLIGKMVDELAARKGGALNITAADAQELSGKVQSLLRNIGSAITSSDLPQRYHAPAFALMAKTLANSPSATASPIAAQKTADEFHSIFNELVAARNSNQGSRYLIDNALTWMGAMCAPLEFGSPLRLFIANDMEFADAARLGLPPDMAQRLTTLLTFETLRSFESNDIGKDLNNEKSIPRQMLNLPDLTRNYTDYRFTISLIDNLEKENVGPEMRNLVLKALSSVARENGKVPGKGSVEASAPNGERLKLEWSIRQGFTANFSISHFDQVA